MKPTMRGLYSQFRGLTATRLAGAAALTRPRLAQRQERRRRKGGGRGGQQGWLVRDRQGLQVGGQHGLLARGQQELQDGGQQLPHSGGQVQLQRGGTARAASVGAVSGADGEGTAAVGERAVVVEEVADGAATAAPDGVATEVRDRALARPAGAVEATAGAEESAAGAAETTDGVARAAGEAGSEGDAVVPPQPHDEVPPAPPRPTPMQAGALIEGQEETSRTGNPETAPIHTPHLLTHSPPGAPTLCPHPHRHSRELSGAAKARAFLEEPCSPTINSQPSLPLLPPAQLRGLEGELRLVRQPHATQPHGPAVLHSSLVGQGHPPSLIDLEASEPSSGLGVAVSDLLAIQNTGIPLPTPTPLAPVVHAHEAPLMDLFLAAPILQEPFHPSPMETDLIFRPCASDTDVGAPLLPASPHPSPSPAPPITTADSSEGTAMTDPTDTATSPDEVVRVRGGYIDIPCAILARVSQDPEAPGPTLLLAAAPTLLLALATPLERSNTAAIAARIIRFGRGEWDELISEALHRRTPLPLRAARHARATTSSPTPDDRRIACCLRLAACNETSWACAALESAEAAPDTESTMQRLRSKHSIAERPTPDWLPTFQDTALVLSIDHLRRAGCLEDRQLWLRGYYAPAARSLLASSTLVALAKPNLDVRPIAIGEVLIRILSRAVCLQLRDQMARVFLASQQFGVGVTCGTEVVVRGVCHALDDHPDWVVLQLDMANAFNSFHRDAMFQALYTSAEFHYLIPFIRLFYRTPSDLLYRANGGVTTIHSERGTGQGDPLSPFLYALRQRMALQPVLAEGDVQLWDFVTSREVEAFTSLGIEVARRGLTVTGVPVGSDAFVERSLPERLERMGRVLPWLPRLRQPQTAARLLTACVSMRPQYLARTVPRTPAVRASFAWWDERLVETFQQLLVPGTWTCREDVREAALDQIYLPIRLGGFGIRRMERIAPIDRSLRTALEGLPRDILSLFPLWHSCVSAAPDSLFTGVSRVLEAWALESVRARHTNPLHLARLTSLQGAGAGAWLTVVPYADSLRIPEAQWQVASAFRLGLPITQLALAGRCSCGQAIDDMTVPHHVVRCSRFGVATVIHDTVKYMLRDFAFEAGFAVKVEDTTLILHLEAARARLQGLSGTGDGVPGQSGAPWGQQQQHGGLVRGAGGQEGREGQDGLASGGEEGGQQQQRQQQQQQQQQGQQGQEGQTRRGEERGHHGQQQQGQQGQEGLASGGEESGQQQQQQ
ncbi:unnamed protein product [Closterium sp. NIES-65]|nr:unnamed protein product [Closterium sp. NIES-65]